ncbi:synemin [Lissotriton helveticus]
MFHPRAAVMDEQAVQLQELNSRLGVYLSRVRQLEQENQVLVDEIESLRLGREVEWKRGYEAEIWQLRRQVEELTLQRSRAEVERDGLWQEFQLLQLLCGEVQAVRAELDRELGRHRADLQQAEHGCRALEELLLRLQAEHRALAEACEHEVSELRGGVLGLTVQLVRRERRAAPSLTLHEVESYALQVSESWKETFRQYQLKVEELEDMIGASGEGLAGVEEEKRRHGLEMGELRKEAAQLDRIRQALEGELRSMKEKFIVEVEEYQIIIESLEDEKQTLALTISDRLKDYQELMQTKTGLSLEVAAYRALLEGETNKGMFTWTEEQIRKIPQGSRIGVHEHATNYSLQEGQNSRRFFPAVHSNVETRHQTHTSHVSRAGGTVKKEALVSGHSPSSTVRDEASYQNSTRRHGGFEYFTSGQSLLSNNEIHRPVPPIRKRHNESYRPVPPIRKGTASVVQESSSSFQMSTKDLKKTLQPGIAQATETQMEKNKKPLGYELSWELKGTKQVKSEAQDMVKEKAMGEEQYKFTRHDLPGEESKEVKATTIERCVLFEGKPNRQEQSYVSEIKTKNTIVLEGENVQKEELITTDVPIKVMAAGNVQEENEGENPIHRERILMVDEQVKSKGESVTHEGLRTIDIPIKVTGARETFGNLTIIDRAQEDANLIVNKAIKQCISDAGVSFVESEELIREYESNKYETSGIIEKNNKEEDWDIHIPVSVEALEREQLSQNISIQAPVQEDSPKKGKEDFDKPVENVVLNFPGTDTVFSTGKDVSAQHNSKTATSWSDEFAEHVTVADILKHVSQSTGLHSTDETSSDAKVTYSETKQLANDGTVTTEIIMQTTTEEDFDLSDEEEIEHLLNSSLEKATLKHLKGMHAEGFLDNILHGGLKGKKGVKIEITEEPLESATDEQGEFSVPFEVEEADDSTPIVQSKEGSDEEAAGASIAALGAKDKSKSREDVTHVEDVTDGGDTGEDLEYIVSTPDEIPVTSAEDDDSLYGQIHIEEESSISYSWQDDFSQKSQNRKHTSKLYEHDAKNHTLNETSEEMRTSLVKENISGKEPIHMESLVIEKEIKIPQEFQTSIAGLLSKDIRDPKHQLKGALEQLEESLPGILREELSALSSEDQKDVNSLAVDIKKVQQTTENGVVTIVAEINVSQTIDSDDLNILNNLQSRPNVSEEQILQSQEEDPYINPAIHAQESVGNAIVRDVSSSGSNIMLSSSEQLSGSPKINTSNGLSHSTAEESHQESPTPAPPQPSPTGEGNEMYMSADMNTFVRHIKLGPKEFHTTEHIIFEGPISETFDLGIAGNHSPTDDLIDANSSVFRHLKLSPVNITSINSSVYDTASSETLDSDAALSPTDGATETNRSIRHIKLGPREVYSSEQIIFEGPITEAQVVGNMPPTEGSDDFSRSMQQVKLGSEEIQTTQQIVFEGAMCEPSDNDSKEDLYAYTNRSIKHFKLSPTEIQTTEHIIFKGPLSHSAEHIGIETLSEAGISKSIRHITLGSETQPTEQIIFKGPISDSAADSSTYVRHIKLIPQDLQNKEGFIFEGPVSESLGDLGEVSASRENAEVETSTTYFKIGSREIKAAKEVTFEHTVSEEGSSDAICLPPNHSAEANRPIPHIKLGPTEKSFTFQMDVTQFTTTPSTDRGTQEAKMIFSSRKFTESPDSILSQKAKEVNQDDSKDANSEAANVDIVPDAYDDYFQANGQRVIDTSMFDKTVQLQRMVDQRSVISDDKKIAVVYLDHGEDV